MEKVFIIDAKRTAIGTFGGSLSKTTASDFTAQLIKGLLETNNISSEKVDEVILGNVLQAGAGQNAARQASIKAGLPNQTTAFTINKVCGSGMKSVSLAAQSIMLGDADCIIAGGMENMSMAPYLLGKGRDGYKLGHGEIKDTIIQDGLWDAFYDYHMGITAENIAEKYNISREEQDAFACSSQNKAEKALSNGKFKDEIIPISIPQRRKDPIVFDTDEYPRAGATTESLAKLRAAFKKDGSVTAGNASGINDGAACLILASEKFIKENDITPLAEIASYASHGLEPEIMGMGPVGASEKALKKANWEIEELDLIEANEAFAVQSIAVGKELNLNQDIVNVNGGAIALGHPIGASGARIIVTLLHEMKREKKKKGLATLCIGGGMGIGMCFKNN